MNQREWEAEIIELMALARRQRAEAIALREPGRALRAQLAIMAAEALIDGQMQWAEIVLDVGVESLPLGEAALPQTPGEWAATCGAGEKMAGNVDCLRQVRRLADGGAGGQNEPSEMGSRDR